MPQSIRKATSCLNGRIISFEKSEWTCWLEPACKSYSLWLWCVVHVHLKVVMRLLEVIGINCRVMIVRDVCLCKNCFGVLNLSVKISFGVSWMCPLCSTKSGEDLLNPDLWSWTGMLSWIFLESNQRNENQINSDYDLMFTKVSGRLLLVNLLLGLLLLEQMLLGSLLLGDNWY